MSGPDCPFCGEHFTCCTCSKTKDLDLSYDLSKIKTEALEDALYYYKSMTGKQIASVLAELMIRKWNDKCWDE